MGETSFSFRTSINAASGCFSLLHVGYFFRSPSPTWNFTLQWDKSFYNLTRKWASRMCSGAFLFVIHHFTSLKTFFSFALFGSSLPSLCFNLEKKQLTSSRVCFRREGCWWIFFFWCCRVSSGLWVTGDWWFKTWKPDMQKRHPPSPPPRKTKALEVFQNEEVTLKVLSSLTPEFISMPHLTSEVKL